ncbi:hypothetical protein P4475_17910 [Halalkalibacterium halodurans]|uniref:hypothetical protein n=1 Tax=Halalkalibacterium halodurans TaxID=86665 RepID=UPI002E217491|nr:hypothetical protein [Halalkalibacterium halodurans]
MVKEVKQFIKDLGDENEEYFTNQSKWATTYWAEEMDLNSTIHALRMRYWNEYVGTEVLAKFMFRVSDPTLRMMVGRQVGDEAKHAFYMKKRIEELGYDVGSPLAEQLEFYKTLESFTYPEEFFTAQQFTVETQSVKRNEQALENFDEVTAEVFRKHINNDEVFHVRLGHAGMAYYCISEEAQLRATTAARIIREKHVAMSLANYKRLKEKV